MVGSSIFDSESFVGINGFGAIGAGETLGVEGMILIRDSLQHNHFVAGITRHFALLNPSIQMDFEKLWSEEFPPF